MSYHFAKKNVMDSLVKETRKLFGKYKFENRSNTDQRIFYISNGTNTNAVCVFDNEEKRLDVFYDFDSLFTCHNLFSANKIALDANGFKCLSIMLVDDDSDLCDVAQEGYDRYGILKYKRLNLCFSARRLGQYFTIVNNMEANILLRVVIYLNHIMRFFEHNEISYDIKETSVLVFMFDDVNFTYEFSASLIENYSFLPECNFKTRTDKRLYEELKNMSVQPGTIYLSTFLPTFCDTSVFFQTYEVKQSPIAMMAMTDTGIFKYFINYVNEDTIEELYFNAIISVISKCGLFDTIITNNLNLYLKYKMTFKKLGVVLNYSDDNPYNDFIIDTISKTIEYEQSITIMKDLLEQFADTYKKLYKTILNYQTKFVGSPQDIADESDDFADSDSPDLSDDDLEDFNDDDFHSNMIS